MQKTVLIINDEQSVGCFLREALLPASCKLIESGSVGDGIDLHRNNRIDAIIVNYFVTTLSALQTLTNLFNDNRPIPVVVISPQPDFDQARICGSARATEYIPFPTPKETILRAVERATQSQPKTIAHKVPFLGASTVIAKLKEEAQEVAATGDSVLIHGESGTGKGVLSHWLHGHGVRASGPFININCAAFGPDLIESELFGHERGSFTGAVAQKLGLLEMANHGTIFLDELADMTPSTQAKILKAIEEQTFRRVGGTNDRKVDIRPIAATKRNLHTLMDQNLFRDDLYFRLSTFELYVPSLRERREDIPYIANHLLTVLSPKMKAMTESALDKLTSYDWPGNIRELQSVLKRALAKIRNAEIIDDSHISLGQSMKMSGRSVVPAEAENRDLESVLIETGGDVTQAAKRLGISRRAIYYRIHAGALSKDLAQFRKQAYGRADA